MLMDIRSWMGTRQLLCSHLSETFVKQGCPLCPLLFAIYLNNIGSVVDGVKGALTGTPKFLATHMLFADDLSLTSNLPNYMQTMLNKLRAYAQRKSLTINTHDSLR